MKNVFGALRPAVILLAALLSVSLGLSACSSDSTPQGYQPLPQPLVLPEFELYDQAGETVTAERLQGRWTVLFYGFTYCPDVCPTTLGELNRVAGRLGDQSPAIVLVSVDPERDTPQQLKQYIEYFNPAFQAWSGEQAQISNLAKHTHIFFDKQPLGDSYTMDHSAQLVLVDPQGRYVGFFPPPHKADVLAQGLRQLMGL